MKKDWKCQNFKWHKQIQTWIGITTSRSNEKLELLQPNKVAALNRAKQLIEKFQRQPKKNLLRWYQKIFMGYLSRDVIGMPDPEYKGF